MINAAANLAERYEYTPPRKYGGRTVYLYDAWQAVRGDMDGDGDVDAADEDDLELAMNDPSQYQLNYPDLDPDISGDLDADGAFSPADVGAWSTFTGGALLPEDMPTLTSRRVGLAGVTALGDLGHQGLMHDEELLTSGGGSLIYNRARTLHPGIRRFMQRDPAGYNDGMSAYTPHLTSPVQSGEGQVRSLSFQFHQV